MIKYFYAQFLLLDSIFRTYFLSRSVPNRPPPQPLRGLQLWELVV